MQMARMIDIGTASSSEVNEKCIETLHQANRVGVGLVGGERRKPTERFFTCSSD